MTEEEVNAKFAEMNQEIFTNKLNIDLDKCYNNLVAVFSNVINAFQKDMEIRIYEILFDSESILSRDEINEKVKEYFDVLREYINKKINENELVLANDINNQELDKYISDIDIYGESMINGISDIYLKELDLLLIDLDKKLDVYSKARLIKILKEIVYKHFIDRCKSSIDSIHIILKNNLSNNTEYLDNMNKSTIKAH